MCLLSGGASEQPSVRRPRAEDHTGVQSHPCGPGGGGHEVGVQGLLEGLILFPRDEDAVGWHHNTTGTGSASWGCSIGTSSYRPEGCGDREGPVPGSRVEGWVVGVENWIGELGARS